MKRTLVLIAIAAVSLAACNKRHTFRDEGEVVKISGTMPLLLSSAPGLLSNESVRLGAPTLIYTIRESDGSFVTLEVFEGRKISRANLMSRVCVGTKISFTVAEAKPGEEKTDPNYGAGAAPADDIIVEKPCTG